MRLLLKIIGILSLLLALGVASFWWLRLNSPLFNFFFTPKDIWQEMVVGDIDLTKFGRVQAVSFSSKYPGNYAINLNVFCLEKTDHYQSRIRLKCSIYQNGILINEFESKDADMHAGYIGLDGSAGIRLIELSSPKDFPLREEVEFRFEVIRTDSEFHKKYGKTSLTIDKDSDE